MAYFTTTPTGFDTALKAFDANREYRVRLNIDTTPVDITSALVNNSVAIQHREGSGAQADIRLRNADGTFEEGAYANATIGIDARVDSSTWIAVFAGWVDDKGVKREIGVGHNSQARIQAHTIEKRHGTRQKPAPTVMSEWKICDPATPATSLVHKLADLMGIATADLDVGTIDYVRDWVEIGKRSPWRELQDLAALYRSTLYTTAAGKLRIRSQVFETTPPTLTPEWSFANDDATFPPNIRDARQVVQGEYVPTRCNRGTCEFDDYESLGAGKVIWLSTQNYDEITRRISIALAPGEYWPSVANPAAVAKLQYKDPVTGVEIPFANTVITPTIGTPGAGTDIESNNGLPTIVSFNGSTGATKQSASHSEIILHNATGGTIVLYKFQLRGTGFRVRANYKVEYQDAAITEEEDFVDATLPGTYAAGEAQVHTALQNLVHEGKGSRRKWTFVTHWLPQVQIAAHVSFRLPGETYTTCRVTGYTHPAPSGPMLKAETRLEIEEVTTFTPTGTPDPVIDFFGDPSPSPTYQEFDAAVDDRPTYAEVVDGFTAGGGTVTPTVPTAVAWSAGNRAIVIEWDTQSDLTARQTFEIQVSDNQSNWYSLDQSGTGLGVLNDETTAPGTMIVHGRLPMGGTADDPTASQWYYRVRRLSGTTPSAYSATVSAYALAVAQGDLAADSIYGNNIRGGEIEAVKMAADNFFFTKSVGSQARGTTPQSGDVRSYLGKDPEGSQAVSDPVEISIKEFNGETWESRFKAGMRAGGGVADAFVSGFFEAGESVLSSPGLIWTERSHPFGDSNIYSVAYGDGVWVAVGGSGKIARSTNNGVSWGSLITNPFGTSTIASIAYGDNVWIAVSFNGKIARSTNAGVDWGDLIDNPFGTSTIYSVAYNDGVWIAVSFSGKIARSTNDGVDWGDLITNPFGTTNFTSVAYGDGVWVAVGGSGKIARSTDGGVTWGEETITNPFGTSTIFTVAYGDGVWVAVGVLGKIARSTDGGVTWGDLIDDPFGTTTILSVAFGNGIWVAVAQSGKIARSTDGGVTWGAKVYGSAEVSQPFGSDGFFLSVIYSFDEKRWALTGYLDSTNNGIIATSDWLEAGSGIVEQGSNANGDYVVFSSGLQVCWEQRLFTPETVYNHDIGTYGWSRYGGAYTWTFPHAFDVASEIAVAGTNNGGATAAGSPTTTAVSIAFANVTGSAVTSKNIACGMTG